MTNSQFEAVVSHPMHYNRGSVEVWDFIADQRLDYLRGNAVKYICRAGFKDDKAQDLLKAREYLRKAMTNTTYPREILEGTEIDPVDFARDQQLPPTLAAALVLTLRWDMYGAIHYVEEALKEVEESGEKRPQADSAAAVQYGTDKQMFADNRTDPRVVEFGKRMGEGR